MYFTVEVQFKGCSCLVLDLCNFAKYLSFRDVEVLSSLVLKFISHQDTVTGDFALIKLIYFCDMLNCQNFGLLGIQLLLKVCICTFLHM
jgi:hypothetical protein